MTDPELKKSVMNDLLLLQLVGVKVVLVHGGGPDINSTLKAMNIESKFSNGLRVTDKETMNVVQMVLAGKVNKGLVADLIGFGGRAIGLCGVDGELIQVHKKNEELGYVGKSIQSIQRLSTMSSVRDIFRLFLPLVVTQKAMYIMSMPILRLQRLQVPSMRKPWWP